MLSSSNAKWRCMWLMMVWSVLLTLVSQFLSMVDHIALYIFGALTMLILPVLTAIYSNTSGRRGSGLLRVGYVICDPVLACVTITPVLLLNHLPKVVNQYSCLKRYGSWNSTCDCLKNRSGDTVQRCFSYTSSMENSEEDRMEIIDDVISVIVPILLSLLMGRQTRKMSLNTYVLTFAYWFIVGIESVDMIDTIRLGDLNKNIIFTTEAIMSITMIIINSYAVVTLCSYISPRTGRSHKELKKKFDLLYRVFVGVAAVLFVEIPLLVTRCQILMAKRTHYLVATFYVWCIKDCLFICLIMFILLSLKFNRKSVIQIPCKIKFDNTDVVFKPEKRDEYIGRAKRVTFQDPPATMFEERTDLKNTLLKIGTKQDAVPDVFQKVPNSVLKKNGPGFLCSPSGSAVDH